MTMYEHTRNDIWCGVVWEEEEDRYDWGPGARIVVSYMYGHGMERGYDDDDDTVGYEKMNDYEYYTKLSRYRGAGTMTL